MSKRFFLTKSEKHKDFQNAQQKSCKLTELNDFFFVIQLELVVILCVAWFAYTQIHSQVIGFQWSISVFFWTDMKDDYIWMAKNSLHTANWAK